jgi:hypothetical protein
MALRTGHGNGAGVPRIEVLPADELPAGVAAPKRSSQAEVRRDALGRPADAESAREMGRRGGRSHAGKSRLASKLGLVVIAADPTFTPYRTSAETFKTAQVTRLALTVGGGECGPAPSSIVASAALQLAASRWAFDRGMHELGSKLANDSRQNLLAAHELCAKEAEAKQAASGRPASWAGDLSVFEKKESA